MIRFTVLGLDTARDLLRSLAKCLAENGPAAELIRATVRSGISGRPSPKRSIVDALRRSPLVGAGLDVERSRDQDRKVDL